MIDDERCTLSSYAEVIGVLASLPVLVREKRRRDRSSLRVAGEESGTSFNTIARTERGEHCSLENAIRLLAWLDGSLEASGAADSASALVEDGEPS